MGHNAKKIAMGLAVVAIGLFIYNKSPKIRQMLGGA